MSIFLLKLIAMTAMLIDHVGGIFGSEGWNFIPASVSMVMRAIGRCSYPIFAFALINGWKHTHDRETYFLHLCMCAVVSMIPYSLAFYPPNRMAMGSTGSADYFYVNLILLVILMAGAAAFFFFREKTTWKKQYIVIFPAAILPAFLLKAGHIWLFTDEQNVIFTFMLALGLLYYYESIRKRSLPWKKIIPGSLVSLGVCIVLGMKSDYGHAMMGVVLILVLYMTQGKRYLQAISICVWGVAFYGLIIGNMINAAASVIPALLILFYNQKKGPVGKLPKRLFYIFYPGHMLVLGLVNVMLKLKG